MAKGTLNLKELNREIFSNKELQVYMQIQAEKILAENKYKLQQEFDGHPVTKEIQAGPDTSNSSGTLGGIGNLFSFIGFNRESDPIQPIRELINKITLGKLSKTGDDGMFTFTVNIPAKSEFEAVTKMPWETGRSWLYDVERSISGLGQYLYGKYNKSRSGSGAQSEKSVRSTGFKPVPYFSSMLENFIKRLK
jgi:hypothetical protein